jgi:signal transduction histidine kinase
MKIRNKLTYRFALLVASILLIFSVAIYFFSASYREQEFDKRLTEKGLTTAYLLIKVKQVDIKLLRIIDRHNLSALQNEKITIYDSLYNKMYSSDDDPEIPVNIDLFREIKDNEQIFFNNGENEVIGILYVDKGDKFFIIVSAYDRFGHLKIRNLKLILIIGFIFSMGAVFLAGWIFSGEALKPISQIINEVKQISINKLHLRIREGNGQDELAQLAIQFNQMLSRLEQAFEMQKSFVSNASHELRTPLSTVRAQLEVSLIDDRKNAEYKDVLYSVLEDINNLIKLSNGLLDLAQVGSDISGTGLKKIRLDELLFQCVSELSKKYTNQQINLNVKDELEDERMYIVLGNEQLLKTAFINVLDNACKFSNNKPVAVNIEFLTNEMQISIIDSGVGIRPAEVSHIFDPFYRGSNVRNIEGHGIGLSLTQKIINLHNGKLQIVSNLNEGTSVIIHLQFIS